MRDLLAERAKERVCRAFRLEIENREADADDEPWKGSQPLFISKIDLQHRHRHEAKPDHFTR